jgi:hypothetical protein
MVPLHCAAGTILPLMGLFVCAIMSYEVLDCRRTDLLDIAAQILSKGCGVRIRARGWSMYPFIKHGDVIEVEPVEASLVRIGDIILCCDDEDRLVAHRVVKRSSRDPQATLVTKGDWTPRMDRLVYPEQVLGRAVAVERRGKRIRLNTGARWLIQVSWARMSPHSRWLYHPVRRCVHAVHRVMNKVCSFTS